MPKSRMRRTSMTILSIRCGRPRGLSYRWGAFQLPTVKREAIGQLLDLAADVGDRFLGRNVVQDLGNQRRGLAHFALAETARSDGRAAQTDAARVERRVHVERDGVLVDGDTRAVERGLGFLAAHAFRENIYEHH